MIFTSYYANWRHFPENYQKVSISLYPPKNFVGVHCLELCPNKNLLFNKKNNTINEVTYTLEFNKQLKLLSPEELYHRLDNSILLCFEKKNCFCHRQLVREWFQNFGFKIEEL